MFVIFAQRVFKDILRLYVLFIKANFTCCVICYRLPECDRVNATMMRFDEVKKNMLVAVVSQKNEQVN